MKVLLSAYACEPGKGSEPAVGWNTALALAPYHEIWVLTRANNRRAIEQELARGGPTPRPHFVYYDLPGWVRRLKRGEAGIQLYYYLWQIGVYSRALRFHREIGFDLTHHLTFGKYWAPSLLALLPVPFVWGPLGGAESAPQAFRREFSPRGKLYEGLRDAGRWLGEHDRLVRMTARRSALAFTKTETTAARVRALGARHVQVVPGDQLPAAELNGMARGVPAHGGPVRFISLGNLLHLKGFHLGLRAFAQSDLTGAEYWIVGDGPERKRLQDLAEALGCAARVKFWGRLPREEALGRLAESHVLVHPSLHDSGSFACVEAMAVGRPVICFDLGGPGAQVTEETGVKVQAHHPEQAIRDLAGAMRLLARDPDRRRRMGEAARQRGRTAFRWEDQAVVLDAMYRRARSGSNE